MKQTKKGFTLVELLVVIAILAILTTVSVVGYTTFIEKANRSVDEQAVAQMNMALMAADIPEGSITNIAQVQELLDECNLEIEDYKPLSKDTFFFYDTALNRVIYTGNKDYNVLYPQDLADKTHKENWFSLNGEICTVTIDESANGWLQVDGNTFTATITTAEQLYTLSENFHNYGGAGKEVIININNDLNMMGAALSFSTDKTGDTVTLKGVNERGEPKQVTISNVANTTAAQASKNNSDGILRNYSCGLFGSLESDAITISNITLFNAQIGDATIGQVGAFVGSLSDSSLVITNCHVVNSTITGKNKVGGMIGRINDNMSISGRKFEISGCTVENTVIETSEGESGTAFGTVQLDPNSDVFKKLDSVTVVDSKVVYTGNSTSTEWVENQEIISAGTMEKHEGKGADAVRYTFSMTSIDGIEFFVQKANSTDYRPFASDAKYFIEWYTTTTVNNETVNVAVVKFVK